MTPAQQWARRLKIAERVLHALVLVVMVVVALRTHDVRFMVYVALGWFAVSLTLRVASGLLVRLERR